MNNVRPSAYVQQWMTGAQYSLTNNDLIDISYVGNHGVHVLSQYSGVGRDSRVRSQPRQSSCSTRLPIRSSDTSPPAAAAWISPRSRMGQLLRRFPEYCSVTEAPPAVGGSTYNALQATYTHRWHSGLDLNVSYTYSKFMDDVQGDAGWAFPGSGSSVRNSYNLAAEHSVDVTDTPHSLVVNYNYELPVRYRQIARRRLEPARECSPWWMAMERDSNRKIRIAALDQSGDKQHRRIRIQSETRSGRGSQSGSAKSVNPQLDQSSGVCPACGLHIWRCSAIPVESESAQILQLRHGHRKMVGPRRGEKIAVPLRNVQRVNHPNFFEPDTNLGDSNFGTITSAYPARSVQFGGKFYW